MKGMSLHQTGVMVHGGKGIDPSKVAKGTLKDVLGLEACKQEEAVTLIQQCETGLTRREMNPSLRNQTVSIKIVQVHVAAHQTKPPSIHPPNDT